MNRVNNKIEKWIYRLNVAPIGKLDWVLFFLMAIFMYFTLFYEDLAIIYQHSLTFLDSAFHLDLGNFYANTLAKPYNGVGAVYYWTVYLVIGIWNIPIWIVSQFIDIDIFSVKCLLWCKLEIVFFFVLVIWILGKILREYGYGKSNIRLAQFMFATALMTVMPTLATAQVDIITVFLILYGTYEYLKTDVITRKCVLIFAFAASLKIFALFVFIPLVLLREKRILAVLVDIMGGLLFIASSFVFYGWRNDYHESSDFLTDIMTTRLFATFVPGGNCGIPIFSALFVIICIWSYVTCVEKKEDYFYYANWISLVVFGTFFTCVFSHPYWIVLLSPYIIFSCMQNGKSRKVNFILEFFINVAVSIYYIGSFGVYITDGSFSFLILSKIAPISSKEIGSASQWFQGTEIYLPVLYGIFAACLLAFIVINYPENMPKTIEERKQVCENEVFDHGMIYLRLLMILVFILANIYISYVV